MNKREKDKFKIRVELVSMAFAEIGAQGAHQILKDWTLPHLYSLLDPEYHFMEEQREVIIRIIDEKVDEIEDNMKMMAEQYTTLLGCKDAELNIKVLVVHMNKIKKQLSKEDYAFIRKENEEVSAFCKELPKLKKKYGLK